VAEVVSAEPVSVKTEPGHGERFSLLPGTLLTTQGFFGPYTKVSIDPSWNGWVDTSSLRMRPAGTPPPQVDVQTIATHSHDRGTRISITLSKPVPFTIEEDPNLEAVNIRLYCAKDRVQWIVYDSSDALVDQIETSQESSEVVRIRVRLKRGEMLWGYHSDFVHSALEIDLRTPPKVANAPASALKGISVFLDPGHMPSAPGAIGPLGTLEMDVNFEIAQEVSALLNKEGARVILSRQSDADEVSLVDRPAKALEAQADLFVSVHNNNLSDGEDPFSTPHGYSVFYYHPHSMALAREIYQKYQREVKIPDENLRYGDLFVLRTTDMPSVLTESAYLSLPDQEALLLTPAFRKQLAGAIVDGLRQFLEKERSRQKRHVS
jgi:N-acetylmuramoyl-L-alanine amidase